MILRRTLLVTLVLLMAIPVMVLAQAQTSGTISGKVTNEEGNPVAGATVTIVSSDIGVERERKTDANGAFSFPLLPVGNWSVTIVAEGLQPQVYSFRLGVGENVPIESVLLPGEIVAEEVTVYSTATAMQTPTAATNIDYRQAVEELPIENRDINVVARLAPQVSDATRTGNALTIAGAPSYDTTVLLDGAEISDPFFGTGTTVYLEDAIEEVQVLTSGISARYGRFQGGIINAITKSGSNQFEATLRYEFDKESWNSQTPFGEDQSNELNEVYQATVGGYFLKDRAWFFGGYRDIPATTFTRTTGFTNESFINSSTQERWQIKLRGAPAPNHIIDIGHLEFDATTDPWSSTNLNPGHLAATTGTRGDPRKTNTVTYQGVLTPNFFVELQATEKEAGIFAGGDPNGGNAFIDWNTFDVFNNYWWDAGDVEARDNETRSGNLTYTLATKSAGSHSFEGGYQYVNSKTAGENKQSPTGINVIGFNSDFIGDPLPNGEPSFALRNGITERWKAIPLGGGQEVENTALYVQDTITVGKWRGDIGVRWDDYQGSGPLPQFNMGFSDTAIRLGLTYNITDRWQLVGTWGQYVSRLNDNVVQGATNIGNAPSIDAAYTGPDMVGLTAAEVDAIANNDAFWTLVTGYSGPDVVTTYLADNITAPAAQDRSLSVRYALPRNAGTLVVNWVNRSYNDLLDDFVGGVCDFGIPFEASCPDGNLSGIPDETGAVVAYVDTAVWANNPQAVREYEGLSFQGDYRPTARLSVGGSYTFSEIWGNYEGEGQNTPASGTAMGDHVRSRPEEAASPFGYLDEDIRHRWRAWAQYRFDLGRAGNLSLSGIYSFNSGQRYSLSATARLADDPEYVSDAGQTYTHFFGGRGTNRFNDFTRIDFGVRYDVPIFKKFGLWVKASVINVFDFDELLGFQTTGSAVAGPSGVLQFVPRGNCGLDDAPSVDCTGWGRISDQSFYQRPREYFFTVGLKY